MAQLKLLGGNLKSMVEGKVDKSGKKNALSKFCDYFPFLVCPCSFVGLAELLSGNFHIFVLSLFSLLGIAGLLYSQFFGWNSTVMDAMIGMAFIGPLWVSCTIAPKVQLSGVKTGVMGEIETLQHTNAQLKKKLQKYRDNIVTLQQATATMTKESKNQRLTVKKSMGISKRLQKEDEEIQNHVVNFQTNVETIENRRKTLPAMINDFEVRVSSYLDTQPKLEVADERFLASQKDTEGVVKELKRIPRRLGNNVESIEYIQEWYMSAGNCAKEVVPLLEQMKEEYNRFSDLIRLQELSFMRKLAYDVREANDGHHFGRDEYNLFVERLPTYLADVVIREQLTFKHYAGNRVGLARHMGRAAVKRFVEDIADGVANVDQTAAFLLMPDEDALAATSQMVMGHMLAQPEKKKKKRKKRGRSSQNA